MEALTREQKLMDAHTVISQVLMLTQPFMTCHNLGFVHCGRWRFPNAHNLVKAYREHNLGLHGWRS